MKQRKIRTPRTRNNGTMTESMFSSMIRSLLRGKSKHWRPVGECKKHARKTYRGPNKRQKFEYECKICHNWFPEKMIQVDHIIPAGSLTCAEDLPGFVNRLFVEVEGLQTVCSECHNIKTKNENSERRNKK